MVFRLLVILLAIFAACRGGSAADPLNRVVANVDGHSITAWETDYIRSRLAGQGDPDIWLKAVARDRLGAMKAEAVDLADATSDLKWRLWGVDMRTGVEPYLAHLTQSAASPEEEVRAYYEEHFDRFRKEATFSFHYIFCETTELRSPAELERVRMDIAGTHGAMLEKATVGADGVKRLSIEDFQAIGGECACSKGGAPQFAGPFTHDEPIQKIIRNTALSLMPGEISSPISTKYGFQILRLHESNEETVLPFETVRDLIRREIEAPRRQEIIAEYVEALKADESRYSIHRIRLKHQLPGAHHETPESPYVVEVGDLKLEAEPFKELMRGVHRQAWMLSFKPETAYETTFEKIVLPVLLHEEAEKAGFVQTATAQAERRILREQLLAHYWVMHTSFRKLADLPRPTTDDYKAYYDANPQDYTNPAFQQFRFFDLPVATTDEGISPAEVEFRLRTAEGKMQSLLAKAVEEASPSRLVEAWRERLPGLNEKVEWVIVDSGLSPEVWSWIASGGEGWYEKPIRTPGGVRILQTLDKRESSMKPFDPKHIGLRNSLKNQREHEMIMATWRELEEEAWSKVEKVDP